MKPEMRNALVSEMDGYAKRAALLTVSIKHADEGDEAELTAVRYLVWDLTRFGQRYEDAVRAAFTQRTTT